jgi:hypothetical protein
VLVAAEDPPNKAHCVPPGAAGLARELTVGEGEGQLRVGTVAVGRAVEAPGRAAGSGEGELLGNSHEWHEGRSLQTLL